MKIHAVATVYNEADIIGHTMSHLYENGIDHIWVAHGPSTDDTFRVMLETDGGAFTVIHDDADYHYQPAAINALTQRARLEGADWVIPFDADEFWYAMNGLTIRDALTQLPPDAGLIHARTWIHTTPYLHNLVPQQLPKVAFRPRADTIVHNGNHWVDGFQYVTLDCLAIREWQFRSLEHLHRKCEERTVRLDPSLPHTDGTHQKELFSMSPEQRGTAWEQRLRDACVYDPIPYRGLIPLPEETQ